MKARDRDGVRARSARSKDVRLASEQGIPILLEESHDLPLVDFQIALRTGSVHDPEGLEGLTRMTARMLRMGLKELDGSEVEERIARLGARLSIEAGPSVTRVHGTVIRRNLEPFFELVTSLLLRPAFRAGDLAQAKRETIADLVASRDNDRGLAGKHFRSALFRDHPYGRSVVGTRKSVRAITKADVEAHHRAHYVLPNLVVGASGAITADEIVALTSKHLVGFPRKKAPRERLPTPKLLEGRRLVIVDKPERTQTQLLIGTLGSRVGDPDLYPLLVANTAFGGTFTARLMHEVRSVRGWSYGAYSRVGQDRQREAWYMYTFPAAKDAAACAALEIELFESFVREGITEKELRFAKNYLINSHCFDIDTASKRLDARMDNELYDLPPDHWRKYVSLVRGVTLEAANAAVRKRLSTKNLVISVVATAKELRRDMEALPGIDAVVIERYDRD